MTDADLAKLAKAGDRRAVEELLVIARPAVRAIVGREMRRQRVTFDIFEDAVAEGMLAVWNALRTWDPERLSLMSFAETGIKRRLWRLAALRGHAVSVPYAAGRKAKTIGARDAAMGKARSLQQPAPGADSDSPPMLDMMAAEVVDPADVVDVKRVLAKLNERDLDIVLRHMDGDTRAEMARDFGVSKELANRHFHRAMSRAQKATVAPFRRAA